MYESGHDCFNPLTPYGVRLDMIRGTAIRYEEATSYTKYNAASSVTGNILTIPSGKYKWSIAGTGQVFVKPMFWRI